MSNYNSKRRLPDHCSSCGTFIDLGKSPKLCDNCSIRQATYHTSRPPHTKKGFPLTHKLKTYTVPTEPWRFFLYSEYKRLGMNKLSECTLLPTRTLTAYIFSNTVPLSSKNFNLLIDYFKKLNRTDLILELHSYI